MNETPSQVQPKYKYYDIIACLFVAVLLISNIVSVKVSHFGKFSFDSGTILFPIAYIFGDILTEVYGYAKSRRIIWTGFFCLAVMALVMYIVQILPPDPSWPLQNEYSLILGFVPRIVFASIVAYLIGEFLNSFILAKMKVATLGKNLWMRTIGSTIVGEAADTLVFTAIAFYGVLPMPVILNIMGTIYVAKVLYEILATPLTYKIVNFLKKAEGVDYYDKDTNFSPFKMD
jgi:uncharacterized integral membrane protein (TIGR00697 family)